MTKSANGCYFRSALADERSAALRMAFQHLSEHDQIAKVRTAHEMIQRGELDPDGIWIAVDGTGLAATMIVSPLSGHIAIVWPPRNRLSLSNSQPIEDGLIIAARNWLIQKGVRLAQTLLLPEELGIAEGLLRQGFRRTTRLIYMRHFLELSAEELAAPERLVFRTVAQISPSIVESVLARTYEDSLDCPELNERRRPAEFLEGHRNAGRHDPSRWFVGFRNEQPVGLVLLNASEPETWDLAYLGVVAEARRTGIGREMVRKSLFEAKAAEVLTVTLALDERNEPAWRLYHATGFEPFDERIVLLADL